MRDVFDCLLRPLAEHFGDAGGHTVSALSRRQEVPVSRLQLDTQSRYCVFTVTAEVVRIHNNSIKNIDGFCITYREIYDLIKISQFSNSVLITLFTINAERLYICKHYSTCLLRSKFFSKKNNKP